MNIVAWQFQIRLQTNEIGSSWDQTSNMHSQITTNTDRKPQFREVQMMR